VQRALALVLVLAGVVVRVGLGVPVLVPVRAAVVQ